MFQNFRSRSRSLKVWSRNGVGVWKMWLRSSLQATCTWELCEEEHDWFYSFIMTQPDIIEMRHDSFLKLVQQTLDIPDSIWPTILSGLGEDPD